MVGKDLEWKRVFRLTATSSSSSRGGPLFPSLAEREGRPGWSGQRAWRPACPSRVYTCANKHLCSFITMFVFHCYITNVTTNIASLNSTHLLCHNFWGSGIWAWLCWSPAVIKESARAVVSEVALKLTGEGSLPRPCDVGSIQFLVG